MNKYKWKVSTSTNAMDLERVINALEDQNYEIFKIQTSDYKRVVKGFSSNFEEINFIYNVIARKPIADVSLVKK